MSVTGRWVRYGPEAANALRAEISAAKGADALEPVTVVVASNQVGVSVRRQLASGRLGAVCGAGPGLIAVSFLTPYRLAELLGASALAGAGRRPVSTPVITAAVRASLAADAGVFAPVAEHPATESALVAAYRELREVSEDGLRSLAATGPRAAEVVRLHRATRGWLVERWYDEQDLMTSAIAVLEGSEPGGSGPMAGAIGSVVVHLPQRLSPHAAALLRAVGERSPVVVLAGSTGDRGADAEVAASLARLGAEAGPATEHELLRSVASPGTTNIVTTSDADDEVRAAVRRVMAAARAGTPFDRIALLHASVEPYGRLLREHLGAAGIPLNGTADVALSARLAARTLLGLLELPKNGLRRQDVFAWLAGAPILHQGGWAPTSSWERLSRAAGVVGGRRDWDELLGHLADRLDAEAAERETDPEGEPWRTERARADAASARALRDFVLGLVGRLDHAAAEPRRWNERIGWAKALLTDLLGQPARRAAWPEIERRATERIEAALDGLASLDDVEGPVSLDVFTRTLEVELDADLGRIGRFGEGVLVAPVSMGVGLDLSLLIVVGMAEGTFPRTVRDDSLLPDDERRAAAGELPLRSNLVDRLHHQFLAVMAGSTHQVLCVPRGDLRRSSERVPSRWVLDTASILAGERWWTPQLMAAHEPWVTHIQSFDDGLRHSNPPATAQEHRLIRLLALSGERGDLHAAAAAIDPTLGAGVAAVDDRAAARLTRFDGDLRHVAVPSPVAVGTSATRLERWADCPHAYFMQDLLRVEPLDQPEDQLRISPMDKGNLVHKALERFIESVLARPDHQRPTPVESWTDADHRDLAAIAAALFDEYEHRGLTGRRIFWQRDRRRILLDLHRFLREDDVERRTSRTRPAAAELAFGVGGTERLPYPLPDGRALPIRGKADRVDISETGTLHVVDYKTGSTRSYKGLSAADPHQGGRHLQLAVYGEAARLHQGRADAPVAAAYWFVTTKSKFVRIGYTLDADVMAQVGEAMQTIVDGIESGLFVPHPKPATTSPMPGCPFCDPDGLGTGDLRRQWLRKQADPALAAYIALAGPHDPEEEATA